MAVGRINKGDMFFGLRPDNRAKIYFIFMVDYDDYTRLNPSRFLSTTNHI